MPPAVREPVGLAQQHLVTPVDTHDAGEAGFASDVVDRGLEIVRHKSSSVRGRGRAYPLHSQCDREEITVPHARRSRAGLLGPVVVAGFLAACSSCTASGSAVPASAAVTGVSAGTSLAPVSMADAKQCPVTTPRGRAPADGRYGSAELRVGGLWPHGIIAVGPAYLLPDGRVHMKFPWWRGVVGVLRISGDRLDAPAPPLRAVIPQGYGRRGFQASAVIFPTEGCWAVTGMVGSTQLTFVTFVIKR